MDIITLLFWLMLIFLILTIASTMVTGAFMIGDADDAALMSGVFMFLCGGAFVLFLVLWVLGCIAVWVTGGG